MGSDKTWNGTEQNGTNQGLCRFFNYLISLVMAVVLILYDLP